MLETNAILYVHCRKGDESARTSALRNRLTLLSSECGVKLKPWLVYRFQNPSDFEGLLKTNCLLMILTSHGLADQGGGQ